MWLRMQQQELKSLVANGNYRPEPELIADAMLRRRSVRALLTGVPLNRAGRMPSAPSARRQAA